MYTRAQYLNRECTLDQYYSQFVNERVKNVVKSRIGLERLKNSTCEHFNDIPLHEWDRIPVPVSANEMKSRGDYLALAGKVCIAKTAALQILTELNTP